jgi:hypothetical protein
LSSDQRRKIKRCLADGVLAKDRFGPIEQLILQATAYLDTLFNEMDRILAKQKLADIPSIVDVSANSGSLTKGLGRS